MTNNQLTNYLQLINDQYGSLFEIVPSVATGSFDTGLTVQYMQLVGFISPACKKKNMITRIFKKVIHSVCVSHHSSGKRCDRDANAPETNSGGRKKNKK